MAGTRGRFSVWLFIGMAVALLSGCGPSVKSYVIDMRYLYSGIPPGTDDQEKYTVRVTRFRDVRAIVDRRTVGWVKAPWWDESVPILPRAKTPAEIVTEAARAQLVRSGLNVSGPAPVWDLNAGTLDKEWGRYVLGGQIEELYAEGKNDPPFCFYDASARITYVLADTETGRLARFTAEKDHVMTQTTITAESLERQVNTVFSMVIADGLESDKLRALIRRLSTP